jgi:hypothetical protein
LSESLKHSEHVTTFVEDERWALVQRIASSRQLFKAPQLREILFYISRRALTDRPGAITEQEIGCKVLGRRPDFNPNEDNIVRAQVRHLRRKLEEYFNSDGAGEQLILTIPKGAYLPRFEPRPPQAVQESATVAGVEPAVPAPIAVAGVSAPPATSHTWRAVALVWILLVSLGVLIFFLLRQKEWPRHTPPTKAGQIHRGDVFWSRIFPAGGETAIVVSDSCLVTVQDILDADIPLSDYLSGRYPEKLIRAVPDHKLQAALELIAARQYTSLGDTNIASKMLDVSRRYTTRTNIRYSRFCSVREFKTGNFILIGSRRGIPWEQLFEPQLNFQLEEDRATRKYHFRNKAPAAGEQAIYGLSSEGRNNQDTYADVALLPNLAGTGYVLLLSGIDMAATEAAGELVTSADFPGVLDRFVTSPSRHALPSRIEFLMQAKAMAGTAEDSRIVCYRSAK